MDVYHGRWPCCNAGASHACAKSQKFYSSAWWNTPLVPRGTFRRFGLRAPIPAENLVSLSVRWGAGAPAKAIRRGGPPLARRTRRPPKHASEPSRAPGRRRRIAGLQACRTVSYATSECRIKNGVIRSHDITPRSAKLSTNYRHLSTCCWIVRGREWAHIRAQRMDRRAQCELLDFNQE